MKSRLKEITSFIEDDYNEIWDTCCDHGKLGISLLNTTNVSKVHFVDCIPQIMDLLKSKLEKMGLLGTSRTMLHTITAEKIKLSHKKSLICICGVGSITAIQIITGLLNLNDLSEHDLILCVQYKTPKLRKFLIDRGFKVQKEMLCFEGKWAHEIMRIALNRGNEIDLIGTPMFDKDNSKHLSYITKSIKHYEKKSLTDISYKNILNLYNNLLKKYN